MKKVLVAVLVTSVVWICILCIVVGRMAKQPSFDEVMHSVAEFVKEVDVAEEVKEQPSVVAEPIVEKEVADAKDGETPVSTTVSKPLAERIVGRWTPVEAAKKGIVISKYGTIERDDDYRAENYGLKGDVMTIGNVDKYTVSVKESNGTVYLEVEVVKVYGEPRYAGRYRLVK